MEARVLRAPLDVGFALAAKNVADAPTRRAATARAEADEKEAARVANEFGSRAVPALKLAVKRMTADGSRLIDDGSRISSGAPGR